MKILHISDLHFHESPSGNATNYKHSLACLKDIERLAEELKPDLITVTGDITNIGDKISLERAYQWIHDQIYSDGNYYGLRTQTRKIKTIIVPGNHDAFNAPTTGSDYKRWQSSLSNFYSVFHQYGWQESDDGLTYKWHDDGKTAALFCNLDSCYLGDTETEQISGTLSLSKIAKGKISKKQSEAILNLFDKGLSGNLQDEDEREIPANKFLSAIKILVMHHYVFEPTDAKIEPLLQVFERRRVFQNIAMSDFDVLLCGHKHIADVNVSAYSDHFDNRAQVRLAFNYVRRILGIKSLPMGSTEKGNKLSKMFRLVLAMLVISKGKGRPLSEGGSKDIINMLESALTNPIVLKEELLKNLHHYDDFQQGNLFDAQEINELYNKIQDRFDRNDRKQLNDAATKLKGLIRHLTGRPFAHIMSASSAKASENGTKHRAVNFYEISNDSNGDGYVFDISRYSWDPSEHKFNKALQQDIKFPATRGLHS